MCYQWHAGTFASESEAIGTPSAPDRCCYRLRRCEFTLQRPSKTEVQGSRIAAWRGFANTPRSRALRWHCLMWPTAFEHQRHRLTGLLCEASDGCRVTSMCLQTAVTAILPYLVAIAYLSGLDWEGKLLLNRSLRSLRTLPS